MEDILKVLVENGVTVAIIAYFIFRDYKFTNELVSLLTSINDSLRTLDNKIKTKS